MFLSVLSFVTGLFVGSGLTLLYLRRRMVNSVESFEKTMEELREEMPEA